MGAGLVGGVYCLIAMVGSDGQQVRWALIFVIASVVFYSSSIARKRDMEEKHLHPGGVAPVWVRYLALGVTILALMVTFWLSIGQDRDLNLRFRDPPPVPVAAQMEPAPAQ